MDRCALDRPAVAKPLQVGAEAPARIPAIAEQAIGRGRLTRHRHDATWRLSTSHDGWGRGPGREKCATGLHDRPEALGERAQRRVTATRGGVAGFVHIGVMARCMAIVFDFIVSDDDEPDDDVRR
jgi:hypothetical protein